MDEALVAQGRGGPNSDMAASQRRTPRASSLSSGCARQDYYYLIGAPKVDSDVVSAAAAQTGQALEADVLAHLEAALSRRFGGPFKFERKVKVACEWFTGEADAWNAEHKILADSKTTNRDSWDMKRKQGTTGQEYARQLNLYAHLLGAKEIIIPLRAIGKRASGRDGKEIYLVERMEPNPALVAEMEAQARKAMQAVVTGATPDRAYDQKHWLCAGFCSYRETCWGGDK